MTTQERSRLETEIPLGTEVACVVRRVEPFGVFVELVDTPEVSGFIKRHDWDWSWRSDLLTRVQIDDQVRARVVSHERPGRLRLSRRASLEDPHSAFRKRHAVGQTVIGEVSLLASKAAGILVTLEGGAEGFVPRSEIPEAAQDRDGFGLVSQDRLAARILRFDSGTADAGPTVVLSIKEHLRARDQEDSQRRRGQSTTLRYHPTLGVQLERLYWHYQLSEHHEPVLSARVRERIRRILIVEDSEGVSTSLEMVFHHFGLGCDVATCLDEAREKLEAATYDLVILDLNLSAERGLELLDDLRKGPSLLFVFVLTAASVDQWSHLTEESQDLQISIFQKPTRVDALFRSLDRRLATTIEDDEASVVAEQPVPEPVAQVPSTVAWRGRRLHTDRSTQVAELLDRLQRDTRADGVVLLSRRPGPIFALEAGTFQPLTREVQQSLEVSPIASVIKERRVEIQADTEQRKAYFRHLVEVAPVRSFAGVPLDYEDQRHYGLFLLGAAPNQLRVDERRLRATARTLGNLLAESRLDDVLAENQGLLLTGFLTDSLLHEIKNELQTLDNQATLQLLLSRRHDDDLKALSGEEVRDFTRATAEIQKVSQRLSQLVVLFGNLAGRSPAERIDLNQTVRRLQSTLRPYARKQNAGLDLRLAADLPEIRVNPRLLEQPLLNLMINGLEQMELQASTSRLLRITTELTDDPDFPLAIAVADTGPGIHRVEWDKVFDLFFTTKNKGTGLGLYLSRFFVEQFGGRLVLRESLMFSGSEFAIELPKQVVQA